MKAPRHELADTRRPIGAGVWIAVCECGKESSGRSKRKTAIRELEHHIRTKSQPAPAKCPRPYAPRFRLQATAIAALGQRWKKVHPGQLQAHAYQCVCGYWHHTKEDQS